MLNVITPGLQTTLQGAPRVGWRHTGVPASGPADPLSMALANRLVSNDLYATCLEITYGGFEAIAETAVTIAVTGAANTLRVNGQLASPHTTTALNAGDHLIVPPFPLGARAYLAISSGFRADTAFGSTSTYLPAQFGGLSGRAVMAQDELRAVAAPTDCPRLETPHALRPYITDGVMLRACRSGETAWLKPAAQKTLFNAHFIAGRQATRMGIELTGAPLEIEHSATMLSAPVFPGTVQCPPSGVPYLLLCDAQTTGGYPRIAHIARGDRHLLGQVRPGDSVRLLERTPEQAASDTTRKRQFFADWLGDDALSVLG